MTRPRILLDCDPGHDDAIAILLAARHCELLGITTVSGNVPLELTTHNALITTQLLDIDAPVHVGAARPLIGEAIHAPDIHGESGLGGPVLPRLEREPASHDAVRYLIDTIRQEDDLWLVATGPLTNVALALRQAPDLAHSLRGISLMGGSNSFGNTTPAAEFNILADPEAADIVFGSGARLLMSGLNLTHQFALNRDDLRAIRAIGNAAAVFVADMMDFFGDMYEERFFGEFAAPLHDPCAVLAVSHPELFRFEPRHVAVELQGRHTRGMTVVDERKVKSEARKNAEVGLRVEREQALDLLLATIASYRA